MAHVLVLGGGFAGVVAAESLAKKLGPQHTITLVSRRRDFIFYPALVRLAFGQCKVEDISYDLRSAMLDRRIEFVEAQVARPNPDERLVITSHGDVEGKMPYDYLVFALGRRLATENIAGFFDHANHLLTVNAALKFGEALKQFNRGHAVIGYCVDARLAIPVYETAFALDRMLRERGDRDHVKITVVSPDQMSGLIGGPEVVERLIRTLGEHNIEVIQDFVVNRVTENQITAADGRELNHDLLMLIPPFAGPTEAMYTGIADTDNYVRVDRHMKVVNVERMYAAGDAVNLLGPKLGHMAVLQAEVAAANIAAEIEGREPDTRYEHEMMTVIDSGDGDTIYVRKHLWEREEGAVSQGTFWSWAKRAHERYWQARHS